MILKTRKILKIRINKKYEKKQKKRGKKGTELYL